MQLIRKTIFLLSKATYQPFSHKKWSYNDNISLYSNMKKAKSIEELFTIHHNFNKYFTQKHLALTTRLLIKYIKKMSSQNDFWKKQNFKIDRHREKWKFIFQQVMSVDINYLNKEELLDYLFFISKSQQHRVHYAQLSRSLFMCFSELRRLVILKITEKSILPHYTIPQLITLFQLLVELRSNNQFIGNIVRELIVQLENNPFCTFFHLILVYSQLQSKYLQQFCLQNDDMVRQVKGIIRKIAKQQVPIAINYVDFFVVVHLYHIVQEESTTVKKMLLDRSIELLPQISKTKAKDVFIKAHIQSFITSLEQHKSPNPDILKLKEVLKDVEVKLEHHRNSDNE